MKKCFLRSLLVENFPSSVIKSSCCSGFRVYPSDADMFTTRDLVRFVKLFNEYQLKSYITKDIEGNLYARVYL